MTIVQAAKTAASIRTGSSPIPIPEASWNSIEGHFLPFYSDPDGPFFDPTDLMLSIPKEKQAISTE